MVWVGNDGNDKEIFLYDGHFVTQLTDNSYDDDNPYINNDGTIAWQGNGELFIATPSYLSFSTNTQNYNNTHIFDPDNIAGSIDANTKAASQFGDHHTGEVIGQHGSRSLTKIIVNS